MEIWKNTGCQRGKKMIKCETLFKTIESLNEEYIKFLMDICTLESPTDYKEGVDAVGRYFADKAIQKGWLVEKQKQEISGDCVCITMNPDVKEAPVCFSGHMDTVHPVGSFGAVPVHLDHEKIYGPGVIDCKGGLAACFMAMDALEKCGFDKRPIKLILQSDEENGSRNSNKTTVKYMGEKSRGCIAFLNTEPYSQGGLVLTRKGIRKYRFEIRGKAEHSSRCDMGVSAICEAAHKIILLEKYKDKDSITCNCGIIKGGVAENTVPENCVFTADFRFCTEEQRKEVDELVETIANTSFVEGTSCEVTLASYRCAMYETKENRALFEKIKQIYRENGMDDVDVIYSFGASDTADLTQMGIICLDGFGTEGGNIHGLNEFAYIKSLTQAAKRLASVAYCI